MTYALRHAQGGPQTEYVVNFNSLIAETTQVPGTWRQNLGLCESQAETHKPVSVASMPMWMGGDNGALQEGLPDSSPSTTHPTYILEPRLCARPNSRCWDPKQTGALSSGHFHGSVGSQSVKRKTSK